MVNPASREPRFGRLFAADLTVVNEAPQRIVIKDVSSGGCSARADRTPPVGAVVFVSIPGLGPIAGSVMWHDKGRFGIRFDAAIDVRQAIHGPQPTEFVVSDLHRPPGTTNRPGFGKK